MKNLFVVLLLGLTAFFGYHYVQDRYGFDWLPRLSLNRATVYAVRSVYTDGAQYYLDTGARTIAVHLDSMRVIRIPHGLRTTYVATANDLDTLYLPNDAQVVLR